jgi:3-hydroxybutyryl-CoA dehydrogenase
MIAIENVGVIGAGMMGTEIALCFAKKGKQVLLKDADLDLAKSALDRIPLIIEKNIKKGRFDAVEKESTINCISAVEKIDALNNADLIIEAVVEDFDIKKNVFAGLDEACKSECIFASNTSSIPITRLATSVKKERAGKFLGMHFFSPAFVMKLVEIIPGYLCEEETVGYAKKAVEDIEKTPVVIKDVAGFAVNRLLNIFFIEAIRLFEEGVASREDIDTACKLGLGHPVGPFELLDITGLDLNLRIHEILFKEYGERFRPRPLLRKMVTAGLFGRKIGAGFYRWDQK